MTPAWARARARAARPGAAPRGERFARQVALLCFALGVWLSAAGAARAREPADRPGATPTPTAPASTDAAAVAPIPAPRIAELVDLTLSDVRGVTARLLDTPSDVTSIQQAFSAFREANAKLELDPRLVPDAVLAPRDIDDLELQWLRSREQLAAWLRTLTEELQKLEAGLDQLATMDQSWQRTLDSSRRGDLPPALVDRIRDARAQIDAARGRVRERRATLLALQADIAALQARLAEHLASVAQMRANRRQDLLSRDATPLWDAFSAGDAEQRFGRPVQSAWRRARRELPAYFAQRPERFAVHVVVGLLFLALMLDLRKRSREWPRDDEGLAAAILLLERPFAAAALCTMLAGALIYVYPPPALLEALFFAIAIAVVRLLRAGVFGSVRGPLFALIGVLVLATLRELLDPLSAVSRAVLLAEDAAMATTHLWFTRHARSAGPFVKQAPWEWRLARRLGAIVGPPALAVAIGANLIGSVTLADEITHVLLAAAYLGVVAYTAGILLDAVVVGLIHTGLARSLGVVRRHDAGLRQQLRTVVRAGVIAFWVAALLLSSDLLDPAYDWLSRALAAKIALGAISLSLGGILMFIAMVAASIWCARTTSMLLDEEILPRLSLPRGVPNAVSATANYAVLLAGFLIAMSAAGFDLSDLALVAGALGVGIGFGLQNVVNNFISGLILIFERPIQLGDLIEMGNAIGEVKHIGIRSSRIRTFEGAEVIVPNGQLISERVVNWTFTDQQRRIELPVGVAYGTNPQQVVELLVAVARTHPDILHYPPPVALLTGFGDSSLNFSLRAWTTRQDQIGVVRSQVAIAVHDALREAGIEIPFPQRDVRLVATPASPAPAATRDGGDAPGAEAPGSSRPPSGAKSELPEET